MLHDKITSDLKAAMLAGDKTRAEALKMLKSALQYKAVELGNRDGSLPDEQVVAVLTKEAKSRLDAARMYKEAGNEEKAAAETAEHALIGEYLPQQLSDEELTALVDQAVLDTQAASIQDMGKVIGAVKQKAGSSVEGSRVAEVVKQKLTT